MPPMMTLLDDHQTYFKHQGIIAVSIFLSRTPAVLLLRTGLNDLIQKVCLKDSTVVEFHT